MIEQQAGIETVMHYACRDRTLLGMQSDLLGAHAMGVRNVLLVTGDPPKLGDYPQATGVFDIDWVSRDGETGIFIGRHDLYGRGIASEAVRLRP